MREDTSSGGIVSEDELVRLTELFLKFEGATDPLSNRCREAESEFNSLVEDIYAKKVKPAYESITFFAFRSHVRNVCRIRYRNRALRSLAFSPCMSPKSGPNSDNLPDRRISVNLCAASFLLAATKGDYFSGKNNFGMSLRRNSRKRSQTTK